ncbi:diphosphomevalonate decarboxylase [Conglomerata obtusa]
MTHTRATSHSHPNIALIKYWGKSDIANNIPTNASLSLSLNKLTSTTTIEFSSTTNDEFFLDDKPTKIKERMHVLIKHFKDISKNQKSISIKSVNNFPHSCGLASSASGFSALVKALDNFYNTNLSEVELSKLARYGSGSAARSIATGVVKWVGEYAWSVGDWKELKVFNVVLDKQVKKVSSTDGMIRTVLTSNLFKYRLLNVDDKIKLAEKYISERDFISLGELSMRESNEMHAIFLDTFPPIMYLNEESLGVIEAVHYANEKDFKMFYSFDAGPNPFIFVLENNYEDVLNYFTNVLKHEIIEAR